MPHIHADLERRMLGLTWRSLKNHFALMPMLLFGGIGTVAGLAFLARQGIYSPDVTIDRVNSTYPWQKQKTQFKFMNVKNIDFANLKQPAERPDI